MAMTEAWVFCYTPIDPAPCRQFAARGGFCRGAAPVSEAPDFREWRNVLVFDSSFPVPYAGKEDACIDGKGELE